MKLLISTYTGKAFNQNGYFLLTTSLLQKAPSHLSLSLAQSCFTFAFENEIFRFFLSCPSKTVIFLHHSNFTKALCLQPTPTITEIIMAAPSDSIFLYSLCRFKTWLVNFHLIESLLNIKIIPDKGWSSVLTKPENKVVQNRTMTHPFTPFYTKHHPTNSALTSIFKNKTVIKYQLSSWSRHCLWHYHLTILFER